MVLKSSYYNLIKTDTVLQGKIAKAADVEVHTVLVWAKSENSKKFMSVIVLEAIREHLKKKTINELIEAVAA